MEIHQIICSFIQRGTVYQSQHFFRKDLDELPIMFGLNVHVVFPLITVYEAGCKQTYRNLCQSVFGLAYIDDIVEGTVDIDKLASVQIGAVGYTCI